MATPQSVPTQNPPAPKASLPVPVPAVEKTQQPSAQVLQAEDSAIFKPHVAQLPVELDVVVPVRDFRVRDLLALQPKLVIESAWGNGEDVPLAAGAVRLAWGEFEVLDNLLAVRVTRLE